MVADSGGDRIAMGWLRNRWGSYLALAVLVFQLALTFGHVHLNLIGSVTGHAAISTAAGTTPDAPVSPDAPDHDHCATCALIHLAQALVAPVAPVLLLPASFEHHVRFADAVGLTAQPLALFRARAPPLA
jgi:hypothetical protein